MRVWQAREELVEMICQKEMGVYQQIFAATGETAALERTERRYNWLRKRLKAREEVRGCMLLARVCHI